MAPSIWQFADFTFEAEGPRLLKQGQPVPLEPKALETLRVFLEQPGEVLDKGTLMARIWPDVAVEETGLARNISLLRKALEDDANAPRYLETVPRKGYRFLPEVIRIDEPQAARVDVAPTGPLRRKRRWPWALLVLPLLALVWWQFYRPSPHAPPRGGRPRLAAMAFAVEPGLEFLNAGFLELLDAELATRGRFQGVSPDTVRRYQRFRIPSHVMGRLLGLDFLLHGKLQRVGDQICLTPRLVDAHSGALVWSSTHCYAVSDFHRLRLEAARRIAQEAENAVR